MISKYSPLICVINFTSYHNKAAMAEGYKTYTPASVGVFLSPSHFSVGGVDFHHVNVHAHKYNTLGVPDSGT